MTTNRCGACVFFEGRPFDRTIPEDSGYCHRFPPHPASSFPAVHSKRDWCGEWLPVDLSPRDL